MDKTILIQGAMDSETEYLIEKLGVNKKEEIYGYEFNIGYINDYRVIVSKTGIGLINATAATILGITNFHPIFVINQGIAGAMCKELHKFDILLGSDCINISSFNTKYRKKGQGSNIEDWKLTCFNDGEDEEVDLAINANNELLELAYLTKKEYKEGNVYKGRIGSGDIFNKEVDRIIWLNEKYHTLAEDMETIAVYAVCKKFNVPAIGIRVISDNDIIGEKYEKGVGTKSQQYAINVCNKYYSNKEI